MRLPVSDWQIRWRRQPDGRTVLEVTDQAGNMSQDVSRQPVVIDMTEPRATVVGVTGSAAARTP